MIFKIVGQQITSSTTPIIYQFDANNTSTVFDFIIDRHDHSVDDLKNKKYYISVYLENEEYQRVTMDDTKHLVLREIDDNTLDLTWIIGPDISKAAGILRYQITFYEPFDEWYWHSSVGRIEIRKSIPTQEVVKRWYPDILTKLEAKTDELDQLYHNMEQEQIDKNSVFVLDGGGVEGHGNSGTSGS